MVDDAIRSMERALAEGDRYVRGPLTQLRQRAGLPGAFADVFLLSDRRALASFDELDALVRAMDAPLPEGYAEYATELGAGEYCGAFRLLFPDAVLANLRQRREGFVTNLTSGDWQVAPELTPDDVRASFPIGFFYVSHGWEQVGYDLLYCPGRAEELVVLPEPRPQRRLHVLPRGLLEPLAWRAVGDGSAAATPAAARYFTSSNTGRRPGVLSLRGRRLYSGKALVEVFQAWSESSGSLVLAQPEGLRVLLRRACAEVHLRVDVDDGAFLGEGTLHYDTAHADAERLLELVRRLGLDPDAPTAPGAPPPSPVEQLLAARAWVLAEGAGP